jgi:hypothetical protein
MYLAAVALDASVDVMNGTSQLKSISSDSGAAWQWFVIA